MKFVLLSDLHLVAPDATPVARKDDAFKTQMRKLDFVLKYAAEQEGAILVAGDFFDKPRSWALLAEVTKELSKFKAGKYFAICSVFGQHDMYMYSTHTSSTNLGVLIEANLVIRLGTEVTTFKDTEDSRPTNIYGVDYNGIIDIADMHLDSEAYNILVIHAPIGKEKMWAGQENYTNALKFLADNGSFDFIHCGDFHQTFMLEERGSSRMIANPGPLFRMEATQEMIKHKPGFLLLDTQNNACTFVEIPHAPADQVLTREHIIKEENLNKALQGFISEVEVEKDTEGSSSFSSILDALVKKNDVSFAVRKILSKVMEEE